MIPPLSICLRFWSPWSPVWRHRYIHNVYTNTRKVLPRLPGSTHARTHAGARIATTNALTLSRAVLLRTRCQVRRGGGGYLVFERYHRDHGYFPRLFGIRSVYAPSFGIQRWNSSSKREIRGSWTPSRIRRKENWRMDEFYFDGSIWRNVK